MSLDVTEFHQEVKSGHVIIQIVMGGLSTPFAHLSPELVDNFVER